MDLGFLFLGNVKNYSQMKARISVYVAIILTIQVYIIQFNGRYVFSDTEIKIKIFSDYLGWYPSLDYVFPLIAGILSYIFILHNMISDWLFIRERFDYNYIYKPICNNLDFEKCIVNDREKFSSKRDSIMRNVFYKYTSSTKSTLVDDHEKHEALTNWTNIWVIVEVLFFNIIWAILSLAGRANYSIYYYAVWFFGVLIIILLYIKAKRNALRQVEAIMNDANARKEVEAYLGGDR